LAQPRKKTLTEIGLSWWIKKGDFQEAMELFNMEDSPRNDFKMKCMKFCSE